MSHCRSFRIPWHPTDQSAFGWSPRKSKGEDTHFLSRLHRPVAVVARGEIPRHSADVGAEAMHGKFAESLHVHARVNVNIQHLCTRLPAVEKNNSRKDTILGPVRGIISVAVWVALVVHIGDMLKETGFRVHHRLISSSPLF